ncbi:hypothetical protein CHARACLAT_022591 [Characodon lateralis]|uniref:Uncharacterized protein n=1 Tax=Characodon lateralis TaxID=208331 RepID=A0ABU7DIY6_9TELE|nr:hypothetical protein [Characodon lateralis]
MSFTFLCSWLWTVRPLRTILVLQLLLVPQYNLHPQPCHLLAQIGHALRVGALLPAQKEARLQVQAALNRAAASLSRDRDPERVNFLPYNLSLDLVSRQLSAADPESLIRCACQRVLVQGVSATLAFPQSREELLQVDLLASVLQVPTISVIEHAEPLRMQVSTSCLHVRVHGHLFRPTASSGSVLPGLTLTWFCLRGAGCCTHARALPLYV